MKADRNYAAQRLSRAADALLELTRKPLILAPHPNKPGARTNGGKNGDDTGG